MFRDFFIIFQRNLLIVFKLYEKQSNKSNDTSDPLEPALFFFLLLYN